MNEEQSFGIRVMHAVNAISCPKGQTNERARYSYRTTEDILRAANPHLLRYELMLCVFDEVVIIGNIPYVKATAYIYDPYDFNRRTPEAIGYAREGQMKLSLDGAQITGSASTYARRYALNALLCIDNTPDLDKLNQQHYTPEEAKKNALEALARVDSREAFEDAMRAHREVMSQDAEVLKAYGETAKIYPKKQ